MFHQTSVSIAPNAFQPLQKRASPSSFWFSEVDLNLFNQKKKQNRETRIATSEARCSQIVNISLVL